MPWMSCFCVQAYKAGLYGPHIVWILIDWLEPIWLDYVETETACLREQITETLQYALYTGQMSVQLGDNIGISGITIRELEARYLLHANNSYPYGYAPRLYVYDTVWAAALALNTTLTKLIDSGRL